MRWTNQDGAPHTATSQTGAFNTGTLGQGQSATIQFDTPGVYPYKCNFHPGMTATLTVT